MPRGSPRPSAPIVNTVALRQGDLPPAGPSPSPLRRGGQGERAAFRRCHLALVREQSKNLAIFESKFREILANNQTARPGIERDNTRASAFDRGNPNSLH